VGNYWTDHIYEGPLEESNYFQIKIWFNYNREGYHEKLRTKDKMREFFRSERSAPPAAKEVKQFLKEIGVTQEILQHCSRPGEYSYVVDSQYRVVLDRPLYDFSHSTEDTGYIFPPPVGGSKWI